MVTKNFTLRTPEDSLTSKYILYPLKQKNFLRGKNFRFRELKSLKKLHRPVKITVGSKIIFSEKACK